MVSMLPKIAGRSSRHMTLLFVATIVLPAAALVFLAWRTLQQDRELERQHIRDRLESVASAITEGLHNRLGETARRLPADGQFPGEHGPPDTVLLSIDEAGITAAPPERLLFYPSVPAGRQPSPGTLAAAEDLEFKKHDDMGAATAYSALARSSDEAVQAFALLGLARCLHRSGKFQETLAAYDRLSRMDVVLPDDAPAELVARFAMCRVSAEMKAPDMASRAAMLQKDLQAGRWRLDRSTFQLYTRQVSAWLPPTGAPDPTADAFALADSAGKAVEIRQRLQQQAARGFISVWSWGRPVLISWENTPARLTALEAAPGYFNSWSNLWKNKNVIVQISDAEEHCVLGEPIPPGRTAVVRSAADTGLPWTIQVASADPALESGLAAGRRRVVLGGLAVVGLLIGAGGYMVARARARELAMARMQKDFVTAVSHEFRSPLTSMRHLLEMLDQGAVSSEERRRQYYRVLVGETARLHRLVEHLLNFGRLEEGKAEYRFENLSARELVVGVCEDFRSELAAPERLMVAIEAPEARVIADREALGRALWNLLDNAAKYSADSAPIRIELAADKVHVGISVRDSGPGIPAEEQQVIFEKFYRGARAREAGVKGTGIGLATVRYIVCAHNGSIELESKPGAGSTFTMVLPLVPHEGEL
jgi:signal transduction histidine kinase